MQRTDLIQLIEAASHPDSPAYARQVAESATWPTGRATWVSHWRWRARWPPGRTGARREVLEAWWRWTQKTAPPSAALAGHYLPGRGPTPSALASAHVADGQGTRSALPAWAEPRPRRLPGRAHWRWATAQREALAATSAEPGSRAGGAANMAALTGTPASFDLARPWPRTAGALAARPPPQAVPGGMLAGGRRSNARHRAAARGRRRRTRRARSSPGTGAANHPYRSLWDMHMSVTLPGPLPAELVNMLGLNRLAGRQLRAAARQPCAPSPAGPGEEIADIQAAARCAGGPPAQPRASQAPLLRKLKKSRPTRPPARYWPPAYVVVSSRTRLISEFQPRLALPKSMPLCERPGRPHGPAHAATSHA